MEYIPLKDRYFKINEEIKGILYLINKFHENIIGKEIKEEVEKFISSFNNYYKPYMGLKRFSIPVFGKISSGKSTLLNYILNLHDLFETNYNISTKFICIVRHNPNLTNGPKIFNVVINERGEYNSNKLWNFEKGEEIEGDIQKIIADRNSELNELEFRHSDWKKYFLILEANIPLFQGFNQVYSDLFEFMDLPGLNEFTGDKEIKNQFYYKDLIPFFIYNVGFSLYIFDSEKEASDDSISIANNIMSLYFGNDPNKQKYSIFIRNKIDKIAENKKGLDIFKDYLEKNLTCHIEKNGFIIGLSGLRLYLKRFKYNSFFDYLFCIIEEYNGNEDLSFEQYIINCFANDFNETIDENLDIIEEGDVPVEDKKLLEKLNEKATAKGITKLTYENYKYYNEYFLKFSKNKKEDLGEQHQNFEELLIKSFNNILNEFYKNFTFENLKNRIINELGLTEEDIKLEKVDIKTSKNDLIDKPFALIKSLKNIIESLDNLAESYQKGKNKPKTPEEEKNKQKAQEESNNEEANEQEESSDKNEQKEPKELIEQIEPEDKKDTDNIKESSVSFIKEMSIEYKEALTEMEQKKIRIPLLGEYSSGKSSLINTIIGHNYNILPVGAEVCTNIALVVKYTKEEKDIALYHTFLEKTSRGFYIFNSEKNPLAKGVKTIKALLNLLNILFSSLDYKESFQNNVFEYVSNLNKLKEEYRIYNIDNLIKLLQKDITIEMITDYSLKNSFENLLSHLNDSSKEEKDFFERSFFLLTIPIEEFDNLNIPPSTKEIIELIDFPGLDSTNNIFKSHVLEHLLKFSDGFIFVNKGNSILEEEKAQMLMNIIGKIQKRKYEFTFKSCLFILNRCDETNIDLNNCRNEFEKIFEIEKREKTWNEILASNNKLKEMNNFNITKFSNKSYSDFKNFKNRINDYDKYLESYESKKEAQKYKGKNYLKFLRKQVYNDVCDLSSEKYKEFKCNKEDFEKYKEHFKPYLNDNDNESIILEIIKMYLFMKNSVKYSKYYIKSNAEDFFKSFENQIKITQMFYNNSLKSILFELIGKINISFEFIKIRLLNDKIATMFKKEDFEQAKNELNEKLKKTLIENNTLIDSQLKLIIAECDQLIQNFKDGNFKSYEKSIEETSTKIQKLKKSLEEEINQKFLNFQKELIDTFIKYIGSKIEAARKNKLSLRNNYKFNDDYNYISDENWFFSNLGGFIGESGKAIASLISEGDEKCVTRLAKAGFGAAVSVYKGIAMNIGSITSSLSYIGSSVLPAVGIGFAACLTFAGLGVLIYKKLTQKSKYIEKVENEKKEIEYDFHRLKESSSDVFEHYTKENEKMVKKFEDIIMSNVDGFEHNKKELLDIYKQFRKLIN